MYRITRYLSKDDSFLSECEERINKEYPDKARIMPNSKGCGYAVFVDDVYYKNQLAKVGGCRCKASSKIIISKKNYKKAELDVWRLNKQLHKEGLS